MITREHLLNLLDVDIDAGIARWKSPPKFSNVKVGDIAGCRTSGGYWKIVINKIPYSLHRIIWFINKGYWPQELDHKDGNPSNNSISNLREVTHQQNMYNKSKQKNNTSGHKGVSWHKTNKKWQVIVSGKFIGYYDVLDEAVEASHKNLLKYHGEYAKVSL